MTLQELKKLFPSATLATWHQHLNGGGWVENTAYVSGAAQVSDNAQVSGDAQVSGAAQVSGDAWVFSPLQIQGTKHFICIAAKGILQIGCEAHTIPWWKEHYRAIGRREGYSAVQIKEYANYIELARIWMKIHGCGEVTRPGDRD